MYLSLTEAAIVLGKTPRQVRYLIKNGMLKAKKEKGCWVIDNGDLPLSTAQRQAMARRAETAQNAMAEATAPLQKAASLESAPAEAKTTDGEKEKKPYSVTDLRAFTLGAEIYREMDNDLGRENPARLCLFDALKKLCRGCHAFQPPQKEARFTEAREAAADAVAILLLEGEAHDPQRMLLANRIETELIPKLAALAAGQEKRARKKQHGSLSGFFPGTFGE
ncbi:MAG: hypothetical protein HQL77_04585 [Magnetococcales bacterium]|nr:hypothetical protein [Magnetococcales bacterium]